MPHRKLGAPTSAVSLPDQCAGLILLKAELWVGVQLPAAAAAAGSLAVTAATQWQGPIHDELSSSTHLRTRSSRSTSSAGAAALQTGAAVPKSSRIRASKCVCIGPALLRFINQCSAAYRSGTLITTQKIQSAAWVDEIRNSEGGRVDRPKNNCAARSRFSPPKRALFALPCPVLPLWGLLQPPGGSLQAPAAMELKLAQSKLAFQPQKRRAAAAAAAAARRRRSSCTV